MLKYIYLIYLRKIYLRNVMLCISLVNVFAVKNTAVCCLVNHTRLFPVLLLSKSTPSLIYV